MNQLSLSLCTTALGKGKGMNTLGIGNLVTELFRYGTRCQGIAQFYLQPTRLSTNGVNHTSLCLRSHVLVYRPRRG